jgi:diacylglycerol O-acyltransferase / wax synthase
MYYEFLDGRDAVFLALEDVNYPMTVGAVQHFAVDSPASEIATVDIARIRARIADRLHLLPRFRQLVAKIPIAQVPIWVDDPGFNLERHVRREPVTADKIGRRIDELIETPFTRQHPLWEIIFLDGYSSTEVTAVLKAHHAMIDGVAGVSTLAVLYDRDPDRPTDPAPRPWIPREQPTDTELLLDEIERRMAQPARLVRQILGGAVGNRSRQEEREEMIARIRTTVTAERQAAPFRVAQAVHALQDGQTTAWKAARALQDVGLASRVHRICTRSGALIQAIRDTATAASPLIKATHHTSLNQRVGPDRAFYSTLAPLDEFRAVAAALRPVRRVTVNDVVLTVASEALRRYLLETSARDVTEDLIAMVPVNVRTTQDDPHSGTRASEIIVNLHTTEHDLIDRILLISAEMEVGKSGPHQFVTNLVKYATEYTHPAISRPVSHAAWLRQPYHLIISSIRGSDTPFYLAGYLQKDHYPVVPLFTSYALVISAFTYVDNIGWGIVSDPAALPKAARLIHHLDGSLHDLVEQATAYRGRSSN